MISPSAFLQAKRTPPSSKGGKERRKDGEMISPKPRCYTLVEVVIAGCVAWFALRDFRGRNYLAWGTLAEEVTVGYGRWFPPRYSRGKERT